MWQGCPAATFHCCLHNCFVYSSVSWDAANAQRSFWNGNVSIWRNVNVWCDVSFWLNVPANGEEEVWFNWLLLAYIMCTCTYSRRLCAWQTNTTNLCSYYCTCDEFNMGTSCFEFMKHFICVWPHTLCQRTSGNDIISHW